MLPVRTVITETPRITILRSMFTINKALSKAADTCRVACSKHQGGRHLRENEPSLQERPSLNVSWGYGEGPVPAEVVKQTDSM